MVRELEDLVELQLRRGRFLYVRDFPFRGLRPDFLVATGEKPIVLEVKAAVEGFEPRKRAIEVAARLKDTLDASAALVVVPDSSESRKQEGIVSVADLTGVLERLGARVASSESPGRLSLKELDASRDLFTNSLASNSHQWIQSMLTDPALQPSPAAESDAKGPRQLFVAMPFDSEFDDVYFVAVKTAAAARGIGAVRIDQKYFSGEIPDRIRSELRKSAAVVADVSGGNPNVLYELGFAHALGLPCIHISRTPLSELPFDVSRWNTIPYQAGQTHELAVKLDSALRVLGI